MFHASGCLSQRTRQQQAATTAPCAPFTTSSTPRTPHITRHIHMPVTADHPGTMSIPTTPLDTTLLFLKNFATKRVSPPNPDRRKGEGARCAPSLEAAREAEELTGCSCARHAPVRLD